MFAERGIEATVPEVAARAGVGKATVYRSFPSKEHLIAAVSLERLEEFERSARERLDEPDAAGAAGALRRRGRELLPRPHADRRAVRRRSRRAARGGRRRCGRRWAS